MSGAESSYGAAPEKFSSNQNVYQLSRLKIASRMPKPQLNTKYTSSTTQQQQQQEQESPKTPILDLKLDRAFQAATFGGQEHSWLIGADKAEDVDSLLDDLDFEDCIDVEGSLPSHEPLSDQESLGSCSPIHGMGEVDEEHTDTVSALAFPQPRSMFSYVMERVSKLARTLDWLTTNCPASTMEDQGQVSSGSNTSRSSPSRSSRSLSAAFDLAAQQPVIFTATSSGQQAHITDLEEFLSACSDSDAFNEEIEADLELEACSLSLPSAYRAASLSPPSSPIVISLNSSTSDSGAESEDLHQSLSYSIKESNAVSEWLHRGCCDLEDEGEEESKDQNDGKRKPPGNTQQLHL